MIIYAYHKTFGDNSEPAQLIDRVRDGLKQIYLSQIDTFVTYDYFDLRPGDCFIAKGEVYEIYKVEYNENKKNETYRKT